MLLLLIANNTGHVTRTNQRETGHMTKTTNQNMTQWTRERAKEGWRTQGINDIRMNIKQNPTLQEPLTMIRLYYYYFEKYILPYSSDVFL